MNYLYLVLFYEVGFETANVKLGGVYNNSELAINRINSLFGGNLKKTYNNAVFSSNSKLCGWINKVELGDINDFSLNINQQNNSIKII